MSPAPTTTLVIPTIARTTLEPLLKSLADQQPPVDAPVILVDDRPAPTPALDAVALSDHYGLDLRVLHSHGRGPAAARNVGWRTATTRWISFLDDDVVPTETWWHDLSEDLLDAEALGLAGSQGRVRVPLPTDRRPTDWERSTHALERCLWITADMSYRRDALMRTGGFDERFPAAFREDADLALRVEAAGGRLDRGQRRITHPVRPAPDLISIRRQRGNADDALMRRLHGPDWRSGTDNTPSRLPEFMLIEGLALGAVISLARGRRGRALAAFAGWAAGTARFAWQRIAPGPRDRREVTAMTVTSIAIPALALVHRAAGEWRHRNAQPWPVTPDAVLLDRDGTLVNDVPYNTDPDQVSVMTGVEPALNRLREHGVRLAIITNQSGIGRGLQHPDQVRAVNERVSALLGPFEGVYVCPHAPDEGCRCRKPQPALIEQACSDLGVPPARCVVIGDIAADVDAATAAGARGILVPNTQTAKLEIDQSAHSAPSFAAAVELVLRGDW